jgi:hypothetical protein
MWTTVQWLPAPAARSFLCGAVADEPGRQHFAVEGGPRQTEPERPAPPGAGLSVGREARGRIRETGPYLRLHQEKG